MQHYGLGGIDVYVQLGPYDDTTIDLVVKSQDIPLDIPQSKDVLNIRLGVSVREMSNAQNTRHWPSISIHDIDRRKVVYRAARDALSDAESSQMSSVGFYTLGLEISRVPSWEVAEEIIRAINDHTIENSSLEKVILIASSPIQVSSFQFALNNLSLIKQ